MAGGTNNRVLVTGATGLVGSYFVRRLAERGIPFRALVRDPARAAEIPSLGGELHVGDLRHPETLRGLADGIGTIYHCAGKVEIWGKRRDFIETNVGGLAALLAEAVRAGSERLVHLSSASVHGERLPRLAHEDLPYSRVPHPYMVSKIRAERLVFEAHRSGQIAATILRPVHIFGPRSKLIIETLEQIRGGGRVFISYRSGTLPTVFVGNLVEAMLLAGACDEALGRAYFVTDDITITWNEFVSALAETFGLEPNSKAMNPAVAQAVGALYDVAYSLVNSPTRPRASLYVVRMLSMRGVYSVERARRDLGYQPNVDLRSMLDETRRWFEQEDGSSPA